MTTLPKEIAEARLAQTQAWNEYMKIIERPHTFQEYHEALNKAGEADRVSADWYRRWQEVGGTSDIESIVDAERFLNLVEVCLTEPSTMKIVTVTKSEKPKYILSRSWADRHLNSDDDLKYFKGGAVIR